jgi:aspartyl-tRNA(Asn)/glutamyl-tRNA(Gln) amidotransferase subunit A
MTLQHARDEAEKLDKQYQIFISLAQKVPGKGIPLSVKDNICTKDLPTTAGSRILEHYHPPYDAHVITKAQQAGYVVIGKTAMDEFGFGSFSTNCAFKVPKNPRDPTRTCGGSSGGSAAHVAASTYTAQSLSESTGGSISCPAAFCGVVGLTPTYGRVSRFGLIDYANSLDKIGTMGKTVKDAAQLLTAVAGHDSRDATSLSVKEEDFTRYTSQEPKKMTIGVIKEYMEASEPHVQKEIWNAVHCLESHGVAYQEVNLSLDFAIPTYYIIAMAEASTNLAKYCGLRYGLEEEPHDAFNEYVSSIRERGFGKEAKRRILLGTYVRKAGWRDAYYIKALKARHRIITKFKKLLTDVDVLAAPTMPFLPPKFKDISSMTPLQHYKADTLTVAPNLAGIPMLSVPTKEGEMVGLHFMADHLQEKKIIQLGAHYERIR